MKKFSKTEIDFVKKTVIAAGKKIVGQKARVLASKQLGHAAADIVTEADIATEQFLKKALTTQFPDIGFYSEETFKTSQAELEKEYYWVVDPIDGTLNFSRGVPIYCISVGLMHNKHPEMGIIYFPAINHLFWAYKPLGAFFGEDEQLTVSKKDSLFNAFGSFIPAKGPTLTLKRQRGISSFLNKTQLLTINNYSTVFHLSHIAAGHYDFGLQVNSGLWDIAAGWALVEAAGGVFEIIEVDQKRLKQHNPYAYSWVAANRIIQPDLAKIMRSLLL